MKLIVAAILVLGIPLIGRELYKLNHRPLWILQEPDCNRLMAMPDSDRFRQELPRMVFDVQAQIPGCTVLEQAAYVEEEH